jgi:hypothetical protein
VAGLKWGAPKARDLLRDRVLGRLGEVEDPLPGEIEAAGSAGRGNERG